MSALPINKTQIVDGNMIGTKGDVETSPKEDVLWMLDTAEKHLQASDLKRVQELLRSIKQLVKHNMEY